MGSFYFKQMNNLSERNLCRCAFKQMHMVGHNLNCQVFKSVLRGNFSQLIFQPCLNWPIQNPFAITQYQNQIVVDYIHAVWAMVGFLRYRPIFAKERDFLHQLKWSGFRHEEL